MELEELKSLWTSLDERLKKQEVLKENIIKEMISGKTSKSVSKLFWSDALGVPLLLLVIPFIVYAYGKFGGKHIMWDATVIFAGLYCIAYFPYLVYRISGLMKINLSGSIKNNLRCINRYHVQIKREKIITSIIGPIVVILVCSTFIEAKVDVFRWVILICSLIFVTLYAFWSYKKIYDKHILFIRKSLEALNELKEE